MDATINRYKRIIRLNWVICNHQVLSFIFGVIIEMINIKCDFLISFNLQ